MDKFTAVIKSGSFVYLLFTLYFVLLLAPLWLLIAGPMWDANDYVYPAFTYIADSIREGRLALWDPYTNCGEPFHAEPQKMTLNPVALLLGVVFQNTFFGFVLLWLLHWWWGGVGMLWLARYFGANKSGALVAAVAYTFSGFFIGHAEHIQFIFVAAWVPWIFGLADRAVATSRLWCALSAAAALGVCAVSGGYPVLVAFTGLAVALWLLLRFLILADIPAREAHSTTKRALWVVGTLCLMAVVAIMMWSPLLHAFFTEAAYFTDRMTSVTSKESLYGNPFSWRAALSLFFPYATILFYGGNPLSQVDWMLADISMTNAYMGALALPLGCVWWFRPAAGRRPWWLLVFVVFMVLVSLGGKAGLRTVLNDLVPFLRLMRFSAPFRLFWIFPVTLSAGLGFTLLAQSAENRRFFARISAAWLVAALLAALVIKTAAFANGIDVQKSLPRIFLPTLVVVPAALLLVWYWLKHASDVAAGIVLPLLMVLVLADMGGHLYINSFTVWTKKHILNYLENKHTRTTASYEEPWGRALASSTDSMNSHIAMKIPVVTGYVTLKMPDFNETLVKSRFVGILMSSTRFWLVPGVEKKPQGNEALKILSNSGRGDAVPVFLENPSRLLPAARIIPGTFGEAKVNYYAPEEIRLEVTVPGAAGGFLASTERYAPGWKAWVDGVPQQVEKTNLFFRGLYLTSGQHRIVWKYQPQWWWQLVVLSYASLLITLAMALKMKLQDK